MLKLMRLMKIAIILAFAVFLLVIIPPAASQAAEGEFVSALPCSGGEKKLCGSDVGACKSGIRTCGINNQWGKCEGATEPANEVCGDGLDNDCDGLTDECIDTFWIALIVIGVIIFFFLWILTRI